MTRLASAFGVIDGPARVTLPDGRRDRIAPDAPSLLAVDLWRALLGATARERGLATIAALSTAPARHRGVQP